MTDALDQLKERLTETQDLGKIARLLSWDQQVMMPRAGTHHRAEQFGALVKVAFEKFTDPGIGKLLDELRPLEDSLDPDSPEDGQRALGHEIVELFGHRPDSWRIDPTEHPFASGPGRNDVRITTHYHADNLHSLFSTMHEYGHGLYSHQQPEHLERLPT